ncbi:MAG: YceG family protein, partial [Niameybacter sp.]
DHITTAARHAADELDAFMYTDSGLFRPWQFTKGTTHPLLLNAIWEDIKTYWDEPARLRPGFKTSGQVVYPPVFFTKISGVHMNLNEYFEGVHRLCRAKRHCFYTQPNFANTFKLSSRDIYSLTYCLNPDKTINREAVKAHPLYKSMLTFRPEVQDFTLDKLDELLSKDASQLFNFKVTDQERTQLMALTFTLENTLLNLIDSYDFPFDIPKLILYINNRATFTIQSSMLLALFHTMGFDILLLCPNGANNIEMMLSSQYIKTLRLPELAYDLELKNPETEKPKSKSFFNKFFK